MTRPPIPRRGFLATSLSAVAALALVPHRALGRCVAAGAVAAAGPHPTPRPGIDASRVLASEQIGDDEPDVRAAFEQVRRIPQIVDGIRCHCGCADRLYSLLGCFEGEHAMAMHCRVCQGQGRLAYRLHRDGKTLDEIRSAIDARYG